MDAQSKINIAEYNILYKRKYHKLECLIKKNIKYTLPSFYLDTLQCLTTKTVKPRKKSNEVKNRGRADDNCRFAKQKR